MPPLTKHQQRLVDIIQKEDVAVMGNDREKYYLWNYSRLRNGKPRVSRISSNVFIPLYDHGILELEPEDTIEDARGQTYHFKFVHYKLEEYLAKKPEDV